MNDHSHTQKGQTQPSLGLSQQTRKHSIKHLSALVRQSYDVFQTYGKQPESLENITLAFSLILHLQTDVQITEAFLEWLRDRSVLPTPSDILGICERNEAQEKRFDAETVAARNAAAREQERLAQRRREELSKKPEMTDEELKAWCAEIKNSLRPEGKKKLHSGTPDATHWEKMSEKTQQNLIVEAVEKIKTAKHGNGRG